MPDRDLRCVELVEVAHQRLIRFGVATPDRLWVTDADAEQEAAWMPRFDAVVGRRYRFSRIFPDIDYPGCHRERGGRVQKLFCEAKVAAG
jgi:hypothetical protein